MRIVRDHPFGEYRADFRQRFHVVGSQGSLPTLILPHPEKVGHVSNASCLFRLARHPDDSVRELDSRPGIHSTQPVGSLGRTRRRAGRVHRSRGHHRRSRWDALRHGQRPRESAALHFRRRVPLADRSIGNQEHPGSPNHQRHRPPWSPLRRLPETGSVLCGAPLWAIGELWWRDRARWPDESVTSNCPAVPELSR